VGKHHRAQLGEGTGALLLAMSRKNARVLECVRELGPRCSQDHRICP
jgi:hypothetical protein